MAMAHHQPLITPQNVGVVAFLNFRHLPPPPHFSDYQLITMFFSEAILFCLNRNATKVVRSCMFFNQNNLLTNKNLFIMKRKILLFATAILLSMASAFAQGGTTGPLTWNLNSGTLTISGTGAMPNYDWNSAPPWEPYVESIGAIVIENGVASIGNRAFSNCIYLASITMPNSVMIIGESSFSDCYNLFSIAIPNSVISIGYAAFSGCSSLISVTIGNSVTTIGGEAFSGCHALTSIAIPNSVTTIGAEAFNYCGTLSSINVESGNVNYSSTDGVLFDKEKTILIRYPSAKTNSSYTIPNSVTTIGNSAFSATWGYPTALNSVTIPNSVTTIGNSAFAACSALTSITIPNSVTTIGDGAFNYCEALTSINVENGNATYSSEDGVLFDKEKTILIRYPNGKTNSSYIIPNSVTTIERDAFSRCYALTSITIPNSVTTIGYYAFGYCEALTSVTLGSGIATLEWGVFYYCTALSSVTNLNPIPLELANDWSNPFYGLNINEITLKVLESSVSAYQAAEVWKEFNIVGGTFLLVTVGVNNNEYGTATGGGYFEANETVTLTATPYPNYKFVNWTKNGVEFSTNNPYSFTATEDIELVANFEKEVGIEKFELANLNIYPNPTTGRLTIEFTSGQTDEWTSIEIFDIYGRKAHSYPRSLVYLSTIPIDISQLPVGVYFVKISTEAGEVIKKVLKE